MAELQTQKRPQRLGTLARIIEITGRKRSSIYRDIAAGRLPAPFKIGEGTTSKLYFDLDEIEAALDAHKRKSA